MKKKQDQVEDLAPELQELARNEHVTLHLDRDPNDPRNRDHGDGKLPSLNDEVDEA
jgi:hypothetical protein